MPVPLRSLLVVASLLAGVGALQAQAAPTLPSDTLQANYAPRSALGPAPQLAPSLPSDTLEAVAPGKPDSGQREIPPATSPAPPDSSGAAERPSRTPWSVLPVAPPPPRIIPSRV
ncbi:MAG: hypothetical protein ACJ8DC_02790 [Gemmatimonadales bacterium]